MKVAFGTNTTGYEGPSSVIVPRQGPAKQNVWYFHGQGIGSCFGSE